MSMGALEGCKILLTDAACSEPDEPLSSLSRRIFWMSLFVPQPTFGSTSVAVTLLLKCPQERDLFMLHQKRKKKERHEERKKTRIRWHTDTSQRLHIRGFMATIQVSSCKLSNPAPKCYFLILWPFWQWAHFSQSCLYIPDHSCCFFFFFFVRHSTNEICLIRSDQSKKLTFINAVLTEKAMAHKDTLKNYLKLCF